MSVSKMFVEVDKETAFLSKVCLSLATSPSILFSSVLWVS
jgi:hypothetical protein